MLMRRVRGRGKRIGTAILTAAVLSVVAAAMAVAALREHSGQTTVDPNGKSSAVAKCPRGSETVSGGFHAEFSAAYSAPAVDVFTSKRVGDRRWKATGGNDGAMPGTLTAFAYCDGHEPGLKERSKSKDIASGDVGSAVAKCPRGSEAVSGGYLGEFNPSMPGNGSDLAFMSKRVGDRRWRVAAQNLGSGLGTLTAFAYCDKSEPGLKEKSKTTSVPMNGEGAVAPKCPNGSEARSGGFSAPNPPSLAPQVVVYESKRVSRRRWRESANGFAGGSGTLTGYTYCSA